MKVALDLARRGLGQVAPNPAVGCVLVRPDLGGRVVGRGWTQPGGRPHAETEAIKRAGTLCEGATAYVTLEPCSHTGETGPCANALIDAHIKRVVIAMQDPDPRVSGRGITMLESAGIDVSIGTLKSQAESLNIGFINKIQQGTPSFSFKTATSLDGKIATAERHSKWITGPMARTYGHLLRSSHDAILIGIGTALADDPELTCRLPGLGTRSPVRIVIDSKLRVPVTHKLVTTARENETWVCTAPNSDPQRIAALQNAGVRVINCELGPDNQVDVRKLAKALAELGLTRVLIEGGAHISSSFLKADLVDQIFWFRAPKIIGGDGLPATQALDITKMNDTSAFVRRSTCDMEPDILETYDRNRTPV